MDENEGLEVAARRELEEETGVTDSSLVQTGAYGENMSGLLQKLAHRLLSTHEGGALPNKNLAAILSSRYNSTLKM